MGKQKLSKIEDFSAAVSDIIDMLTGANHETRIQMQVIIGDLYKLSCQCVDEVQHEKIGRV